MTLMNRRKFLASAAATVAATRLSAQSPAAARVTLTLPAEATGPHMPADFVGLSYEVQQLVDTKFFSGKNAGLIHAFKELSTKGVLRLGGNTGEFGYWRPTLSSPEPEHPKTRVVEGEPKPDFYPVTEEAILNLAAFLEASGWTCIYGINMGTNTPQRAAEEAVFVEKTLGSRLQYFQIGNEPDLFSSHLRDPQTWSAKTYLDEWLSLARAIAARVPNARFGMPDIASKMNWLPEIATLWPSIQDKPNVTTVSHHHYFNGPPSNPDVTIANLLKPATIAREQQMADTATAAARSIGARVRMTEGNTCYRGGKPGVSDVFAAALWAADYSLLLASNNYTGINLHGGTGPSVANGLGGALPGDLLLRDQGQTTQQIAAHPHPFYTPIATFGSEYALQPVAYGLKFAGSFSGGTFFSGGLTAQIQAAGVNGSAYAARLDNGQTSVIVVNKDAEKDLDIHFDFGTGKDGRAELELLSAPALESREARIFPAPKPLIAKGGKCEVHMPQHSGLRITFKS